MYTGNWKIVGRGRGGGADWDNRNKNGMRIGIGTGLEFAQNNAWTRMTQNSQVSYL